MNNKKKYVIAVGAFIVCFIMFVFAIKAQKIYANKVTKQEISNKTSQSKTTNSKDASIQTKGEEKKSDNKREQKTDEKNSSNKSEATKNDKAEVSTSAATATNSQSNAVSEASTSSETAKTPVPNEEPTFTFIDTVNGNSVILQKHVDMEGENVGYITCKLLDEAKIKYRATGSSSTIYFAAINGLEEKKAGPLSGWCYYVKKKGDTRFHKPNIGSGQWTYEKGDLVVWKYLADGIHDGYSDDWK